MKKISFQKENKLFKQSSTKIYLYFFFSFLVADIVIVLIKSIYSNLLWNNIQRKKKVIIF